MTKRTKNIIAVTVSLLAILACAGIFTAAFSSSGVDVPERIATVPSTLPTPWAEPSVSAAAPSPSATPTPKRPAPPVTSIDGNDLVHVGEDVPAGTYRAATDVEGMCYWAKSKDPEGEQLIDNDIPPGGRPQVTLRKGQWFSSQGCPEWVEK